MKTNQTSLPPRILPVILSALLPMAAAAGSKDVVPVVEPTTPEDGGWEFLVKPYGWATGISGSVTAGSLGTDFDLDPIEVLENLDGCFFLQAEARNGRWGLLFDGFYAQISGSGTPPGSLYSQAGLPVEQGLAELAVSYRILEGEAGFLDIFAGARYNMISMDLNAAISDSGLRQASQRAGERIISGVQERAESAISRRAPEIRAATEARLESIRQDLREKLLEGLRDQLPPAIDGIRRGSGGTLDRQTMVAASRRGDIAGAWRDYVEAALEARIANLRSQAGSRAAKRLKTAEDKLAKAIEKSMGDRLPEQASADKDWVDPFVGFRGQWNITREFFLAGRADVGGFGVGSELVWQASASLGYAIDENWSVEAGYRHMDIELTESNLVLNMAESGVFLAVGYEF